VSTGQVRKAQGAQGADPDGGLGGSLIQDGKDATLTRWLQHGDCLDPVTADLAAECSRSWL